MVGDRDYHHGDLRRVLIAGAVDLIAEHGPAALSLRELARRAGVSHAAPAHHFTDKARLLTAVAVEGHQLLAEALQHAASAGSGALVELGTAYVHCAIEHPAHFEVMYRNDLLHRDDPDLLDARARTRALLHGSMARHGTGGADVDSAALTAWSLAHGFATLWCSGAITASSSGRPAREVFREVAAHVNLSASR